MLIMGRVKLLQKCLAIYFKPLKFHKVSFHHFFHLDCLPHLLSISTTYHYHFSNLSCKYLLLFITYSAHQCFLASYLLSHPMANSIILIYPMLTSLTYRCYQFRTFTCVLGECHCTQNISLYSAHFTLYLNSLSENTFFQANVYAGNPEVLNLTWKGKFPVVDGLFQDRLLHLRGRELVFDNDWEVLVHSQMLSLEQSSSFIYCAQHNHKGQFYIYIFHYVCNYFMDWVPFMSPTILPNKLNVFYYTKIKMSPLHFASF